MSDTNLLAWLGPAAGQLTAEQIEQVAAEAALIDQRYPDPDEQSDRDAALSVVVQYLLGDTTAEDAARTLLDARRREREAYVAALQHAVMLTRDGVPDATAARRAGIDRMGLLKALGKR